MEKMRVKKFSEDLPDFNYTEKGDWIDLYINRATCVENAPHLIEEAQKDRINTFNHSGELYYDEGDVIIVGLGVAIDLPDNHEANVVVRSSTFKNTGLILTNDIGVIDEIYKGNNDEWQGMFYATRDGQINRFDRLLQFKAINKMKKPEIIYVEKLNNDDRGGYGTSGR